MKKVYLLMLSVLLSGAVIAQTDAPKFGIRAGVNLASQTTSTPDLDETSASRLSFHFFGYTEIPLSSSFSFQPGIGLSGKGAKIDQSESVSEMGFNLAYTAKGTVDIMYLEIPLNAIYKSKGFYFGAGPYFAYALSGKQDYVINIVASDGQGNTESSSVAENGKVNFGNEEGQDDYKTTDYGLNFLAGYQLKNNFTIGASYGLGLANIAPKNEDDIKAKNKVISFSIGYAF